MFKKIIQIFLISFNYVRELVYGFSISGFIKWFLKGLNPTSKDFSMFSIPFLIVWIAAGSISVSNSQTALKSKVNV